MFACLGPKVQMEINKSLILHFQIFRNFQSVLMFNSESKLSEYMITIICTVKLEGLKFLIEFNFKN